MRTKLFGVALTAVLALNIYGQDVQKQPQVKSQAEANAVMAVLQANDPDARIEAGQTLLRKFKDTEFKAIALHMIAASYQQKNDYENMVVFAEQSLEADPNGYQAMLMLATGIAQRTREHDLDREEKLGRSEKYARKALEILKDLPKPRADVPDDQWEAAKKDFGAQAHEALGLGALARKKYDVAITEFKTAVDTSSVPDPATMLRLGAAYNLNGQPDLAIPVLDKVMAAAEVHPTIKQLAQAERARAFQAKTEGAKPAGGPPAPAEIEISRP